MSKVVSEEEVERRKEEYKRYKKYINSKEFDIVRKKCFERDSYRCLFCNWSAADYVENLKSTHRSLQCHHRCYDHLYDELNHMEDVATFCSVCHQKAHMAPSNYSRFKNKPKAK